MGTLELKVARERVAVHFAVCNYTQNVSWKQFEIQRSQFHHRGYKLQTNCMSWLNEVFVTDELTTERRVDLTVAV